MEHVACRPHSPLRHPSRTPWPLVLTLLTAAVLLAGPLATTSSAQAFPSSGRFGLFASWSERDFGTGTSSGFNDVVATLSLRPGSTSEGLFDYALDARIATYPSTDRDTTFSLYDAYVGFNSRNGRWRARAGQMWIQDVGGIGAVGGLFGEYRVLHPTAIGQIRFGLFAGLEPDYYDAGYVEDVSKGGLYAAVDGAHGRRHVLGYVHVKNSDVTERSVVVFNNYFPVARKLHVYQALEYDTQGPAGLGSSELTYFFANLRYSPVKVLDLQGTYHRGRSIDYRSITRDQLDGRPVSPESLDGLLYESGRLRVTVRALPNLRVWASFGQDRNNDGDTTRDRIQVGLSANRLFGSGVDFSIASSRYSSEDDDYDALYASLGTSLGRSVYLSLDYNRSLSMYRYDDGDGGTIEVNPDSQRFALSANINLNKTFSFLVVAETIDNDSSDERRLLSGIVIRF